MVDVPPTVGPSVKIVGQSANPATAKTFVQNAGNYLTDPHGVYADFADWYFAFHMENNNTAGGNSNTGSELSPMSTAQKGTASVNLAYALKHYGVRTSAYFNDSYTLQGAKTSAGDSERATPLGIHTTWPTYRTSSFTPNTLASFSGNDGTHEGNTNYDWVTRTNCTLTRTSGGTVTPRTGTGVGKMVATTTGDMLAQTKYLACTAGTAYTAENWFRAKTDARSCLTAIRFGTGTTFTSAQALSGATLNVADTTNFSASGTFTGYDNAGAEHTITYTGKTSTSFTGCSGGSGTSANGGLAVQAIGSLTNGAAVTDSTSDYVKTFAYAVAPATTTHMRNIAQVSATATTSEEHWIDDSAITEADGARLTAAINNSTTTITVSSAAAWKPTAAPASWPWIASRGTVASPTTTTTSTDCQNFVSWIRLDNEICAVTAVSGPTANVVTLTVVRGMWGTTAASHVVGSKAKSPNYVISQPGGFGGFPSIASPSTTCLRYSLDFGVTSTSVGITPAVFIARRRAIHFDAVSTPPSTSNAAGWATFTPADAETMDGSQDMHADVSTIGGGPGFPVFNVGDYTGVAWSPTNPVTDAPYTSQEIAATQYQKATDVKAELTSLGYDLTDWLYGFNNASGEQDDTITDLKTSFADPATAPDVDRAILEFYVGNTSLPPTGPAPNFTDRVNQWFTICANNWRARAWCKVDDNASSYWAAQPVTTAQQRQWYRRFAYGIYLLAINDPLGGNQDFMSNFDLPTTSGVLPSTLIDPCMKYVLGDPTTPLTPTDLTSFGSVGSAGQPQSGVYRRDFDNGGVVVNINSTAKTVDLGQSYWIIKSDGTQPIASTVTIPPYDAAYFATGVGGSGGGGGTDPITYGYADTGIVTVGMSATTTLVPFVQPPIPIPPVFTVADWLGQMEMHLEGGIPSSIEMLASPMTATDISLTGTYSMNGIESGSYLGIGLEVIYVWDVNGKTVTPIRRGMLNSTPAIHEAGTLIYINPRFSRWQMFQAFNAELRDLSGSGLFQMKEFTLTSSAVAMTYAVPSTNTDIIDIYDIRWNDVGPLNDWPRIDRTAWLLDRKADTTKYPSGVALRLDASLPVGRPIRVQYRAPFTEVAGLGDDVVAVTGLPATAVDIPLLGAAARLLTVRESERSYTDSQGDSRRPSEVPVGASVRAGQALMALRNERLATEVARLSQVYPL